LAKSNGLPTWWNTPLSQGEYLERLDELILRGTTIAKGLGGLKAAHAGVTTTIASAR